MNTSDLDVMVPQPKRLDMAGQTLEITPLVVGELPAMLKAVRPFAGQLADPSAGEPDWVLLLTEHGDALLTVLALGCRRDREWVDSLAVDDALVLATAIFEVNADFFIRRIAPRVSDLAHKLNARLAGPMPSPA